MENKLFCSVHQILDLHVPNVLPKQVKNKAPRYSLEVRKKGSFQWMAHVLSIEMILSYAGYAHLEKSLL